MMPEFKRLFGSREAGHRLIESIDRPDRANVNARSGRLAVEQIICLLSYPSIIDFVM